MPRLWNYAHQDLGEPSFVDGSPILRPVVPLVVSTELPAVLGVLDSGARPRWRLPFAVLLGQRGWFNQFPTRIDARMSAVEVPEALS
jgi:hypothetical protein